MNKEEFKNKCEKGHCSRSTLKSKKCLTDEKRELCYTKFLRLQEKHKQKNKEKSKKIKETKIDQKWEDLLKKLWERDADVYTKGNCIRGDWQNYCRFWKCLTKDEKSYVMEEHSIDFWLNKNLDGAHIISRSEDVSLKYDLDNVVLIGRLWHSLLDQYKDPLTRESINKDERMSWMLRIKENKS
jgi:hypothetical protein